MTIHALLVLHKQINAKHVQILLEKLLIIVVVKLDIIMLLIRKFVKSVIKNVKSVKIILQIAFNVQIK